MIRINLLERRETQAAAKPQRAKLELGGGVGPLVALLIVAGGLGFVAWRYLNYEHRMTRLNADIATAEQRIAELDKALKTMDEFQAKKKSLEHRVQIISDLKRKQDVPVLMLDVLSRQVPDFLWIEDVKEKGAGELTIAGRATTYNAVSNFYNNLKDSPFFSDVTLGGGALRGDETSDVVSFGLSCKFIPPKPGEEPGAPVAQPSSPGSSSPPSGPAAATASAAPAPRG